MTKLTVSQVKEMGLHARPADSVAPGWSGYRLDDGRVCWRCTSRAMARGFGSAFVGHQPVWDEACFCDICQETVEPFGAKKVEA